MAPKFVLFTKGSKLPLNKGFKNMFELYYRLELNPRYVVISSNIKINDEVSREFEVSRELNWF